jgi:hypothetical protein
MKEYEGNHRGHREKNISAYAKALADRSVFSKKTIKDKR